MNVQSTQSYKTLSRIDGGVSHLEILQGQEGEHIMATEIYYFSGTGNSLHVARELQARIPETRFIPIVSLLHRDAVTAGAETVGLVFPQYASSTPKVVDKFIGKLNLAAAQYIFAIVTRGGTTCYAFDQVDKLLKKTGRRLDAYFVLTMPSGSAPLVEECPEELTGERTARLESEMLEKLDAIQATITAQETHREEDCRRLDTPPPAFLKPYMPIIDLLEPYLVPLGKLAESRFGFYADSKCNGCGLCERVCLARKIQMVDGRPVWQDKAECFGCLACLNYCPETSVQIASTWYLQSWTTENGRYHHPQISAKDIAGQKRFESSRE
jgi:NAD-dependent dihydropyrimidine dehydrogenase PreA subunit/flavodoxin